MAIRYKRRLVGAAHRLARRDAQLLLNDVDARDLLGHRMLDLHARVHFHEVELAVVVEQELDGARIAVIDRANSFNGGHRHIATQGLVKRG